jgi:signal transduction histidine kinase/CheY-like chemotaxis protein
MRGAFITALNWFIPTEIATDPERRREAQLLLLEIVGLIVWGVPFGALFVSFGATELGVLMLALSGIGLTLPFLLKATGSILITANIGTCNVFAGVVAVTLVTGGLGSPALAWALLVPLFALFTADRRSAFFWLFALCSLVVGLFVFESSGGQFEPMLDPQQMRVFEMFSRISLFASAFAAIAIYQRNLSNARRALNRANAEIGRARDAALESTRLKSELLANLTHEIRTPMNAIAGMAEVLEKSDIARHHLGLVETIKGGAASLLKIIDDILSFSKAEAGRLTLENTRFELHEEVEQVVRLLRQQASGKGLGLEIEIAPEVPRWVEADAGKLRQVLLNLIGNAVKFTSSGSVTVDVTGERRSTTKEEYLLTFSIIDTGVGIPDSADHLFDPFTQIEHRDEESQPGAGLGLSIAKQIVSAQGGTIGAEPRSEGGARFWFRIPLTAVRSPASSSTEHRKARALVIESDPAQRQRITVALEGVGMSVEAGSSAPLRPPIQAAECLYEAIVADEPFCLDERLRSCIAAEKTRLYVVGSNAVAPKTSHAIDDRIRNALSTAEIEVSVFESMEQLAAARGKILITDDNELNQRVLLSQLTVLGYRADAVATGEDTLQAVETGAYALVLMDCRLPERDGPSITREIRSWSESAQAQIPIVGLTASSLDEDRERGLDAGMNEFMVKPVDLETLACVLFRHMATETRSSGPNPDRSGPEREAPGRPIATA